MSLSEVLASLVVLTVSLFTLFVLGFGLHAFFSIFNSKFSRKHTLGLGFLGLNALTALLSYWSNLSLMVCTLITVFTLLTLSFFFFLKDLITNIRYFLKLEHFAHHLSTTRIINVLVLIATIFPASCIFFFSNPKTYIGAGNPDYFQSAALLDVFRLGTFSFYQDFSVQTTFGISESMITNEKQARFSALVFANLIGNLFSLSSIEALNFTLVALSVILGLSLIAIIEQEIRASSKHLIIFLQITILLCANTIMSFGYMFIGQNSVLFVFPLLFSILIQISPKNYLKSLPIITFLLLGVLFCYIPVFPVLSMLVVVTFTLHVFATQKSFVEKIIQSLRYFATTFAAIIIVILSSGSIFTDYLSLLFGLKGSETNFLFEDWLGPFFFPYLFGFTTSPAQNSVTYNLFGPSWSTILIVISLFYLLILLRQTIKAYHQKLFVIPATIICFIFIASAYTILSPSGWSIFKLSAWFGTILSFIVLLGTIETIRLKHKATKYIASALLVVYTMLNMSASLEIILKLRGEDRSTGTFVNSYGFSTDYSFEEISSFIDLLEKRSKFLIVTGFVEAIILEQNVPFLKGRSFVASHTTLPVDDKYMLDVYGNYIDAAGVQKEQSLPWRWKGDEKIDYVVMSSTTGWNADIVRNSGLNPIYEDKQFGIYDFSQIDTLTFTGRGFSRPQYSESNYAFQVFRTTYSGFEIFVYSRTSQHINLGLNLDSLSFSEDDAILEVEYQINSLNLTRLSLKMDSRSIISRLPIKSGLNRISFRTQAPTCPRIWNLARNPIWCPKFRVSQVTVNPTINQPVNHLNSYNRISINPGVSAALPFSWFGIESNGWVKKSNELRLAEEKHPIEECYIELFRDGGSFREDTPLLSLVDGENKQVIQTFKIPVGMYSIKIDSASLIKASSPTLYIYYGNEFLNKSFREQTIPQGSIRLVDISCTLSRDFFE